mmetsp:Transcript_10039/g.22544  ORF Transcript_10039/g.22544 Transcript_10039/m.22544 type:complete len:456 (-) Transcript_10039:238-1605(-)
MVDGGVTEHERAAGKKGVDDRDHADSAASDLTESLGMEAELTVDELWSLNPFDREAMPNFSSKRWRYMAIFDTERWAAHFSGRTFATASTMLSRQEAVAILQTMREHVLGHKSKRSAEEQAEDAAALCSLRQKIADLMSGLRAGASSKDDKGASASGMPFFVRLGPRSPKDAPVHLSEVYGISRAQLLQAMDAVAEGLTGPATMPDDALHHFQTVASLLLRVTTADQAINLLVSSHRVMQDLSHSLDHSEGKLQDVGLVVRTWDDSVALEREFRTFLVGGKVAAITQYDDQLCYPFVVQNRAEIVRCILRAVQEALPSLDQVGFVSDALGNPRAVVADLLVVPAPAGDGSSVWQAKLIEFNPFGPMTGGSFFSWASDRRVLQAGHDLFGDLQETERQSPPCDCLKYLPPAVVEERIEGVPFRYLSSSTGRLTWEHLEVLWEDYMAHAPPSLLCRP